jgi:hypothetical protein
MNVNNKFIKKVDPTVVKRYLVLNWRSIHRNKGRIDENKMTKMSWLVDRD